MPQSTVRKIQSFYSKLSDKEKKIADYILEHRHDIIHSTISEVASDVRVADATVFRFCKRIGFNGFQEMKIALASEVTPPIQQIHEEISEEDDIHTIAMKVFKSNMLTLENTLAILSPEAILKATEYLNSANKIHFFGTGGSAIVALDAYHKFMRTGIPSFAFTDSHFQLMAASQMDKDDVAVIISHSGVNKDTINILKTVNTTGAKTIAITAFPKSPIAQQSDILLLTTSEETEYRSEALSSRIAQLTLIDALYVNVMVSNKEESKIALDKLRSAISQTRG